MSTTGRRMPELHDLSFEQRQVVESFGQGLAVSAGAGSGKTTTLVIKCAELVKRNPQARFAAVSFTERSAADLRASLSRRFSSLGLASEGGVLSGHWVMTIHGLCASVLREYPREAGVDGEENILSEPEGKLLWEKAVDSLWLEEIPDDVAAALDVLMSRESRSEILELLERVRNLELLDVFSSLETGDAFSAALGLAGRYVIERFQRLKRRRGALDFSDLERCADRALEHPHVRESFHRRFDLVLIDEFQDTNPVQARILWRFARPDQSNLCVVGDPKQSIYRFRDADVSVFEECCARLPHRLSLSRNFRSRPGIIEFANRVCAPLFEESGLGYEPLVADRAADESMEPCVRLDFEEPKQWAAWLKAEIDRGIPAQDFALLLRKIRGNEHWLAALHQAGVPFALGSGGLFWNDSRVRELVAFLKWWDNPGNELSGAIFLRSPWVGVEDPDLDQWRARDRSWRGPFFESAHPLAKMLSPFRQKHIRPGELLLALLESQEIENELGTQLLGLWHRCEDLSLRGMGFHEVVQELDRAVSEGMRSREVPPPTQSGQVAVLTLHASKGLEFPHVILVDFARSYPRKRMGLLLWEREKGAFVISRNDEGARDYKAPGALERVELEERLEIAESKRVFYVALTRAKERVVLACARVDTSDPKKWDALKVLAQDHWAGWLEALAPEMVSMTAPTPTLNPMFSDGIVEATGQELSGDPLSDSVIRHQIELKRPRHSVTEWNLLGRCPRAYEWTFLRPRFSEKLLSASGESSSESSESFFEVESSGLSQRELGTAVHACLEHEDFEGLREIEKKVGEQRFRASVVEQWSRSQARPDNAWSEVEFEAPISGEVVVGAIDRITRNNAPSENAFTVMDYKITRKPKSEGELLESYGHQMKIYSWALGMIEPDSREKTRAVLVNISPQGVSEVELRLPKWSELERELARAASHSNRILAGESGAPRPGSLCRHCSFLADCPEGRASLE